MIDGAFLIGLGIGAFAILAPWVYGPYRRYVMPCAKVTCPHHGEDNARRLREANDRERNGPNRPDI